MEEMRRWGMGAGAFRFGLGGGGGHGGDAFYAPPSVGSGTSISAAILSTIRLRIVLTM